MECKNDKVVANTNTSGKDEGCGMLLRRSASLVRGLALVVSLTGPLLMPAANTAERHTIAHGTTKIESWSEGQPNRDNGNVKVIYSIETKKPVFFITIDDGWFPNEQVLKLMKEEHVPITAFIIKNAMLEHPKYWKEFCRAGGQIENHTVSHPDLDKINANGIFAQIDGSENGIEKLVGAKPYMFRPPYGAFDKQVMVAASADGIKYIVMWTDEIKNGRHGYNQGHFALDGPGRTNLRRGDIVLLHWVPGLDRAVRYVLDKGKGEGLAPANLSDFIK